MKSTNTAHNAHTNFPILSNACAACKYRRRKCTPDCLLAPHFPSTAHRDFLHAHKLFGVSNLCKAIKSLNSFDSKRAAVKSMVFQAKARAADPVGGCHRIVYHLKNQIEYYEKELHLVRQRIALHKALASHYAHKPPPPVPPDTPLLDALPIQPAGHGSEFLKGNFEPLQVFDGFPMKVETEEMSESCVSGQGSQLSGSNGCDEESFVNLPAHDDDKVLVAVDLSEDIKPLLGGFDERYNASFWNCKKVTDCRDKVVLEEDDKPIQHEEEEDSLLDDTP